MEKNNDDVHMAVPMESLKTQIPSSDTRRAVLARDPLAGVDGFRTVMWLVFDHIRITILQYVFRIFRC